MDGRQVSQPVILQPVQCIPTLIAKYAIYIKTLTLGIALQITTTGIQNWFCVPKMVMHFFAPTFRILMLHVIMLEFGL